MKHIAKLSLTPELAGAIGNYDMSDEEMNRFEEDPSCFFAEMGIEPQATVEIQAVYNSEVEMHIALPYYSSVEEANPESIEDANLEDISGGEIVSLYTIKNKHKFKNKNKKI